MNLPLYLSPLSLWYYTPVFILNRCRQPSSTSNTPIYPSTYCIPPSSPMPLIYQRPRPFNSLSFQRFPELDTQTPGRPPSPHSTSASPPLPPRSPQTPLPLRSLQAYLPPRSPRILDLPLPRPLISSKGLTGSLQPLTLLPPTSTRQTLKRPILPSFFPQKNPGPTLPLYFPPISPTTSLPQTPTLFPPTSETTQSQISPLPPTILPTTVSPHPVFKRDYGRLHYDDYAEYHYHDEVYHPGEEKVVQTIESLSSEEASTFPPNEEEPFPSNQDPGLASVSFPLPASSASTCRDFQFTLLLLLMSTLRLQEFFFLSWVY